MIYKYDYNLKRNFFFVLDVIIVSVVLAAVHLDLVLSLLAVVTLLYTAINNKISFMMVSLAGLIGTMIFYLSTIGILDLPAISVQPVPNSPY